MRHFGLVVIAACASPGNEGPAAPVVTAFSPTRADYGAVMTIEGSGFGDARDTGATLLFTRPGDAEPTPYLPWNYQVKAWDDDHIAIQIAFPMTGTIWIENAGGRTEAGTFESASWDPNIGTEAGSWNILDVVALGEDRAAAILAYDPETGEGNPSEPHLVIFGIGTIEDHVIAIPDAVVDAHLVVDARGEPEALVTTSQTIFHVTWDGTLRVSDTGISSNGVLGDDAQGLHVWEHEVDGYFRARPPAWTPELVVPRSTTNVPSPVASGGGVLFLADVVRQPNTTRGERLHVYKQGPDDPDPVEVHSSYGEAGVEATRFAAGDDGDALVYDYCYTTYDPIIGTTTRCYTAARSKGELWGYETGDFVAHPGGGLVASFTDDAREIVVARPEDGRLVEPTALALFAAGKHRPFFTPAGALRVLVVPESLDARRVYFPRQR